MNALILLFIQYVYANTLYSESSYSLCPNFCSGHGICLNNDRTIACSCFNGYHGGDCSYRLCPSGKAWFEIPSAAGEAHPDFTECSNMVISLMNCILYL